jgi:large subunit ribosomal protein L7/L12
MAEEKKEEQTQAEAPKTTEEKKEETKEVEVPEKFQKLVSEIEQMTVLDLAEFVKILEEKFGVSAAMPAAAPAAAGGGEEAQEEAKSEFKVELTDVGSEKFKVIKALRKVNKDLGLTEAKKMIEELPAVLGESVPKEDAEEMKKTLEEVGAKVKLV